MKSNTIKPSQDKTVENKIKYILSKIGINEPKYGSWRDDLVNKAYKQIMQIIERKEENMDTFRKEYTELTDQQKEEMLKKQDKD